jgi:hypothetical protein
MKVGDHSEFWGAHAYSVLVSAFCRNELLCFGAVLLSTPRFFEKFANAECVRQHAASVRSPEMAIRISKT